MNFLLEKLPICKDFVPGTIFKPVCASFHKTLAALLRKIRILEKKALQISCLSFLPHARIQLGCIMSTFCFALMLEKKYFSCAKIRHNVLQSVYIVKF